MSQDILEIISTVCDRDRILVDEPMNRHTTFRVGGKADYFVALKSKEEAAAIVRLLLTEKIPFYVCGNGSNLLVSDNGYRGVVLCFSKDYSNIEVSGNKIVAGAGAMLSKVANTAIENGLNGLVFATGIPGSIGGATVMNAGAYGGQFCDVCKSVELLDLNTGEIVILSCEDMNFGYRTSIVKTSPYVVLSVTLELEDGDIEKMQEEAKELAVKRREKQPLEYPSAGSTFKRPEGFFAGKLIEDAGLKGYSVGGAQVSTKHSGFVINKDGATAEDVINLIKDVRRIVFEKFEVTLEPEVCMLGEGMEL